MGIHHVSNLNPDGTLMGQSSTDKLGFYGLTTPIVRPSAITTVDTTTITTVDTTTLTPVEVMTATTTHLIVAVNLLIVDSQLQAETINKLVADARLSSLAVNTGISRLQALGLIA